MTYEVFSKRSDDGKTTRINVSTYHDQSRKLDNYRSMGHLHLNQGDKLKALTLFGTKYDIDSLNLTFWPKVRVKSIGF